MTPITCPRDRTPLRPRPGGVHLCPTCHHEFVVSISDAWTTHVGWNRTAVGAGAVIAVMEATARTTKGTDR